MDYTVIIDPGHGGFDAGAVYQNRKEKDDNLRLALAVGKRLENDGYHVIYTRTMDQYDSPYEKAQIGNNAGGDVFISFHRNFAERTDLYHGIQALVYGDNPVALRIANNVNARLEAVGFDNLGIDERRELVVLRRTSMPAVLLEVGFINSTEDNRLFDEKFDEIVDAITIGIEESVPEQRAEIRETQQLTDTNNEDSMPDPSGQPAMQPMPAQPYTQPVPVIQPMPSVSAPNNRERAGMSDNQNQNGMYNNQTRDMMSNNRNIPWNEPVPRPQPMTDRMDYYVQVGLFRYPENAVYLMEQLKQQGYDTTWKRIGGLIAIWVGPESSLDNAVQLQQKLQDAGYDTLVVTQRRVR